MTSARVGVIGGGSWGTTLAHLAAVAGSDVTLWVRSDAVRDRINAEHRSPAYTGETELHAGAVATTEMGEIRGCPLILVVVPSQAFRGVAAALGDHIDGSHLVVHATKGLERETDLRMSEVLMQETCCRKIGALAGPNLSAEILAGE
ncbi:MAG: glycerol-3-phosphate dehydrogenase, partial [Gemmatimonadetes bacterium]|nr:glycerol-3-phosphate dehydrogenase [Gemmatimonadota bacterium]